MKIRIRSAQDFWSGIAFVGAGGTFLFAAQKFAMGSAADIGPAFFPSIVAGLLVLVGVGLAIGGLAVEGPAVEPIRLRPAILVIAGLAAFGLIIEKGGLVPAVAALVLIASAAGGPVRPLRAVLLAAGLVVLAIAIFRLGLGMPIRLWP